MTDYEEIELAVISLDLAEDYLSCFAMHLQQVKQLKVVCGEVKLVIGDLRVTRKLLELELGGLRDAGRDNMEGSD